MPYLFSTDEAATENILKAELTMAALCGRLGLVTSRDAFITAICKGSLPPHYALTVLNATTAATLSNKCKNSTVFFPSIQPDVTAQSEDDRTPEFRPLLSCALTVLLIFLPFHSVHLFKIVC